MKKAFLWVLVLSGVLAWGSVAGAAQEKQAPLTKEDILRLLKPVPGSRYGQGDLAGEIGLRGIAFPLDEATLEQFRKAGAKSFVIDALQRAAAEANRPRLQQLPENTADAAPTSAPRPRLKEAPPAPPKEELTPEAKAAALAKLPLLERARYHAEEYLDELPNFVVTQFVSRSVQTPEKQGWQAQDKLEIELTYSTNKGERFKLLRINDKPTQRSYDELGGATSTGEFGSMLAALFSQRSQAEFKEVKREPFRGRPTVVYDFRVKKAFSSHQLTDKSSGRSVTTAYQGTVWIDVESGRVLRIEQAAEDIQRGFPITMAESAVEYDWVTIAGAKYLMPVYAEVILGRESDRFYSRNVIELRNYHVFETDVKILIEKDPPQ